MGACCGYKRDLTDLSWGCALREEDSPFDISCFKMADLRGGKNTDSGSDVSENGGGAYFRPASASGFGSHGVRSRGSICVRPCVCGCECVCQCVCPYVHVSL